jgi:putative Mn2+ efflux pump MntP
MPLLGYFIATWFADKIISYDHWIAFALLGFLGAKMIFGSFKKEGCADRVYPEGSCSDRACPGGERPDNKEISLNPSEMLHFAFATSIDALAVGVSLAFLQAQIVQAVSFIGTVTFVLSILGVKLGHILGIRFKSKAELAGGIILVLIGVKILLEHLRIIG